ncbi:GtrA family protein [Candidatus Methylocalor cossyra]|uniref:GtrA/DPMS transmembrane domain-containing protein n=1 Tax=Candidatus Methylocalor cossyra TaxID=3108543 RepID=A0ABM9NMI8_9GAMM
MIRPVLKRAVRFGITGVLVTGCHSAYAVAAVELNGWRPTLANGLAFTFATMISYLLNARWSFSSRASAATFAKFWSVCGIGLLLAIGIGRAVEHTGLPYGAAIVLTSVVVPPVSFTLHTLWTFRGTAPGPVPSHPRQPAATRKRRRKGRRPYQRLSR